MRVRFLGTDPAGGRVSDVEDVEDVALVDIDAVRQLRELVAERTGLREVELVAVERRTD